MIDPILREDEVRHTPREDLCGLPRPFARPGNLSVAKAFTVLLAERFGYLPSQVTFIRIRTCAAFPRCFFDGRTGFRQPAANREAIPLVLPRAGVFAIFYAGQWHNDVPSTSRVYSVGTVFQAMFPNLVSRMVSTAEDVQAPKCL